MMTVGEEITRATGESGGARRGRPPVHSRDELLKGAARALLQRGFEGLRFADAAEEAGVPVASLRHYFPTVGELRTSALRHLMLDEYESMARELLSIADPWQQLLHIAHASATGSRLGTSAEWLLWLEYYRTVAYDRDLRADYRKLDAAYRDALEAAIAEGVAQGVFTTTESTADVAALILSVIDGLGLKLAMEPDALELSEAHRRTDLGLRLLVGYAGD